VAEQLADGDLGVRLPVSGSHEVARLARSFNRMADSLQDQITQLEQLSSMQQTFVSDVSHELRTPLTTVRMAAEVLFNAREDFDPVNRRSAELLYHQVDRFDSLLADLLEISRFDAGAARLEVASVELFSVVHDVVEGAAPLAVSSGSTVRVRSELSRCTVQGDQRRIERILRNLVVNALEHGEGRPIDIVVGASEVAAAVAVRDQGIGMTEEEADKVFNRFWRADPARARTTGG
ncbi:HAMP domain-containing sensor histidine kinase, partial [Kocuria sp. CPCC 205292]